MNFYHGQITQNKFIPIVNYTNIVAIFIYQFTIGNMAFLFCVIIHLWTLILSVPRCFSIDLMIYFMACNANHFSKYNFSIISLQCWLLNISSFAQQTKSETFVSLLNKYHLCAFIQSTINGLINRNYCAL